MKVGDLVVYQAEAGCICPQMLPQFIKMHKAGFSNCKQPGTFMPPQKKQQHLKKAILLVGLIVAGFTAQVNAQTKWESMTNEQKLMKAKEFREENQNYLKNTLGLTQDQADDIDNVNLCYLTTLERIERYGKTEADKEKYAKSITNGRSVQMDAIMGVEKRKQYQEYIQGKLKAMAEKMK